MHLKLPSTIIREQNRQILILIPWLWYMKWSPISQIILQQIAWEPQLVHQWWDESWVAGSTGAEIEPRSTPQCNQTPELIKPTGLYCIIVFWWWFFCCRFYIPMILNQFSSPGSDSVSGSIADYLWLLMEAQRLSFCTSASSDRDRMEQTSCADPIYFKDIQPHREGQELSSLSVPDQPDSKSSSCKPRHLFKVVARHCGRTGA